MKRLALLIALSLLTAACAASRQDGPSSVIIQTKGDYQAAAVYRSR